MKKKARKGYAEMTLNKLTLANLSHHRKKSLLTMITLGMIGVMFMTMATVLSCISPEQSASYSVASDYRIEVESWARDKMNPDREWPTLVQQNPLTPEFEEQILAVDGVMSLTKRRDLEVDMIGFKDNGVVQKSSIRGLSEKDWQEVKQGLVTGKVNYRELTKKKGVLIDKFLYVNRPEILVGSALTLDVLNGDKKERVDFVVLGWINVDRGLIGDYSSFYVTDSVFDRLSDYNTIRSYDLDINPSKLASATMALDALTASNDYLNTETYQAQLTYWKEEFRTISSVLYGVMAVIGGLGIMSLINTVVNSIYTRKRELGIIQALGMTEKQMIKMLQIEGLVYTVGTVIVSLTVGNLFGYLVYLYAFKASLLNITTYSYPWQQTFALIILVMGIQLLLTIFVSRSFRKNTLVERMRFAE